ncbi:MAG: hypothetical protein DSY80_09355 [Desulfocapsa sp.]|nr:MAG: hypothetical protein DSY80_09355 [Desulfocapsa sp.]
MTADENNEPPSAIISFAKDNITVRKQAEKLSANLHLPVVPGAKKTSCEIVLFFSLIGLELHYNKTLRGKLHIDFDAADLTYRKQHGGGIKQPLARAIGIKANIRPSILDATAGLGIDSYLLASFGCRVRMIERSPFLAALLNDALQRIQCQNPLLLHGEAEALIAKAENRVDTIYLDPMYPPRGKSALNRQEMRIIRALVGDDDDADRVFLTALRHAAKRVVVKRPKAAPLLSGKRPSHVIKMKSSRFDVYMV